MVKPGIIYFRIRYLIDLLAEIVMCYDILFKKKTFIYPFDSFLLSSHLIILSRLLSQQRRIMEEEKGRHNGLPLSVLFMVCNLAEQQKFSVTKKITGSYLKLLNRPRSVLKLQGKTISFHDKQLFDFSIYLIF